MEKTIKEIEKICLIEPNENYKNNKSYSLKLVRIIETKLYNEEYTLEELRQLTALIIAIGNSKNRMSRYVEESLEKEIADIVYRHNDKNYSKKYKKIILNEIEEETLRKDKNIELNIILYDFALEVLNIKIEKNRYCDRRRANALRIIGDLIEYYKIKRVRKLFKSSINTERRDELFFALDGLKTYYEMNPKKKMSKSLLKKGRGNSQYYEKWHDRKIMLKYWICYKAILIEIMKELIRN